MIGLWTLAMLNTGALLASLDECTPTQIKGGVLVSVLLGVPAIVWYASHYP